MLVRKFKKQVQKTIVAEMRMLRWMGNNPVKIR